MGAREPGPQDDGEIAALPRERRGSFGVFESLSMLTREPKPDGQLTLRRRLLPPVADTLRQFIRFAQNAHQPLHVPHRGERGIDMAAQIDGARCRLTFREMRQCGKAAVEERDRFAIGRFRYGPCAGSGQILHGRVPDLAAFGVVGERLCLPRNRVRLPLFEVAQRLAVQAALVGIQQALIGRVMHQRVLEGERARDAAKAFHQA